MNKKFIAVLLIIGFILTGLSSITAADNITSVADNNNDESVSDSLTDDNAIDESATDESGEDENVDDNEESVEEENVDDNAESDDEITDEELDEEFFDSCALESEDLYNASEEDISLLVYVLDQYDSEDLDEVIDILENRDDYDESDLCFALYNLNDDAFELYNVASRSASSAILISDLDGDANRNLIDLLGNSNNTEDYMSIIGIINQTDYNLTDLADEILELNDEEFNDLLDAIDEALIIPRTPTLDDVDDISKDTDSNQATTGDDSSVSKDTNSVVKNTKVSNNNQNNIISKIISPFTNFKKDNSHMSVYDIYHNLLEKYLAGEITFDQLKKALEDAGIDTTDLKLNEDNSITFLGETSPVPEKLASDNQAATNDTQDENQTSE